MGYGSRGQFESFHHANNALICNYGAASLLIWLVAATSSLSDFLQKTYFVESPSFGMHLSVLLLEDSSRMTPISSVAKSHSLAVTGPSREASCAADRRVARLCRIGPVNARLRGW